MNKALPPQGVNVLPYLLPLQPFEVFNGLGLRDQDGWYYDDQEEKWTVKTPDMLNRI